jgi:PAS domain S-box-containing protein
LHFPTVVSQVSARSEARVISPVSLAQFTPLLEESPVASWITRDGAICYVNPAACALLRIKDVQKIVGSAESSWLLPSIGQRRDATLQATLKQGGGSGTELVVTRWPIFLAEGRAMQVNLAPVEPSRSGRQSTGDPQEQRQHRLEEIYGTLPVGLAYHDRELRYVYVNEYLANLNGRPAAEHAGRSFREMAPPAVADYAEPLLVRVLETGVPLVDWEVSLPDLKHKERTRDWLIQYHPVRESGVVTGVYSIVQEITEHRQMERLLESNEELFRATFEQTSVGIAHVGLNGNWLRVNQRVCEITGYKEEELLQLSYHDITHPDDRVLEDELGYKNLVAGKVQRYSLEKRCVRKDGKIAWVYVTGSLMRDSTAKPLYEIAVIEDISARKRAEAELRKAKSDCRRRWMPR